jgi:hypothetical protein
MEVKMNANKQIKSLIFLKEQHKKQDKLIEALEAERAPELSIKNHKRLKLSIKDEIAAIENELQLKGIKYE